MKQEMIGCQWHQLDHMQIICTSFQTNTMPALITESFFRLDALSGASLQCCDSNGVIALKACINAVWIEYFPLSLSVPVLVLCCSDCDTWLCLHLWYALDWWSGSPRWTVWGSWKW